MVFWKASQKDEKVGTNGIAAHSNKKDYSAIDIGDQENEGLLTVENVMEGASFQIDLGLQAALIGLLAYFASAIFFFSFVFEKWSMVDSFYFSIVTFTTIGYGDFTPESEAGKLFNCFFALFGVAYIGLCLVTVGSNYIDGQVTIFESMEKRIQLGLVADNVEQNPVGPRQISAKHQFTVTMVFNAFLLVYFAHLIALSEGWTTIETLYFCVVSATTIGYGDFTPRVHRFWGSLYLLWAVGTLGYMIAVAGEYIMILNREKVLAKFTERKLQWKDIAKADTDEDGKISKREYVEFMLVSMNIVDQDLIHELHKRFDEIDVSKTGVFTKQDMKKWSRQRVDNMKDKLAN